MKNNLNIVSLDPREASGGRASTIVLNRQRSRNANSTRPRLSDTDKFLATISIASLIASMLCIYWASRTEAREWSTSRPSLAATQPANQPAGGMNNPSKSR